MRKKFFIFLVIFSLLIINGKEYRGEIETQSFNIIEKYFIEECEFVQNGIKLEYSVKESLEEEYARIVKVLDKNELDIIKGKNNISAYSENINYNVKLIEDNEILKVEIIILNNDKKISQVNLVQVANSIKSNELIDERYFSFVKGKIDRECEEIFNKIRSNIYENSIQVIQINNGYSMKATMIDNKKINIGKVDYDTGSYLIIGTPIIFITY